MIERLSALWPALEITVEQIHTVGDRVTDMPLSRIGGDGVFVTEIEHALRERRIDLAVHSLKDLPTVQPDDLRVVVMGPREDVRDVFIANEPFTLSRQGLQPVKEKVREVPLRIGTCSLRRTAQIRQLCPDAQILPLRGNVDTRLRKLAAGDYDGIILAAAGLHRLGMQEQLAGQLVYFPVEVLMPAPGQGALALEIRNEPALLALLEPLKDVALQAAVDAERMFMRRLGAGCYLPVAAYGCVEHGMLTLRGLVASLDGQRAIRVQKSIAWPPAADLEHAGQASKNLGMSLGEEALAQGASEIIGEVSAAREREPRYV